MSRTKPTPEESNGRFAYEGLERIIHEKARLGILTSLATRSKGLSFSDLKELCALTDGNLSRHMQILEEAGLVEVIKTFRDKRPQTRCRLTKTGRKRFIEYLGVLERVIADATGADESAEVETGLRERFSPA